MKTVTFSVDSREDFNRRALSAFAGQKQGAHISFLATAGIVDKTEQGVVFPFDVVHVDFELTAA